MRNEDDWMKSQQSSRGAERYTHRNFNYSEKIGFTQLVGLHKGGEEAVCTERRGRIRWSVEICIHLSNCLLTLPLCTFPGWYWIMCYTKCYVSEINITLIYQAISNNELDQIDATRPGKVLKDVSRLLWKSSSVFFRGEVKLLQEFDHVQLN